MAAGIRQFLTFEELLQQPDDTQHDPRFREFSRSNGVRQTYFDALEVLRGHLSRCLGQVAALAGMETPSDGLIANYRGPWDLEALRSATIGVAASCWRRYFTAAAAVELVKLEAHVFLGRGARPPLSLVGRWRRSDPARRMSNCFIS
jgi:hypothetical protein